MSLNLNDTAKYTLAKAFTELAIQNGLINKYEDPAETAKQITTLFDTIAATIDTNTKLSE